jgi:VWFA-related protein
MSANLKRLLIIVSLFLCSLVFTAWFLLAAQQPNESTASGSGVKIQVNVNAVLVPVVVRDSHGRAIGNLKKEDFQVFDKDKPQVISGFSIQKRAGVESEPKATERSQVIPSIAAPNGPAPQATVSDRSIVFLFDDLHLDPGGLLRTQKMAMKILSESLADSDMAAVVSLSGTNSGLTRNRAKLREAVMKVKVQQLFRHDEHTCPNIDYYQADLIQNKRNEDALKLAMADYATCAHLQGATPAMIENVVRSAAGQSLAIGERDVWSALATLSEIVRRMGTLQGQRSLILISPGFLTLTPAAMAEKSHILDLAAQTNVTISALDARGLYTTEIDASERGGSSARDLMTGQHAEDHSEMMSLNEDVMSELADGTGGTFFHNSNDLEGGLKSLAQGPEYMYLLEFSPEKFKPDGSYHRLKVRLDQSGFKVQARQGYFAPAPPKTKK